MASFGWSDLILALVVVLIILGPERLREAGRSLGRRMHELEHPLSAATDAPAPDVEARPGCG